MERFPASWVHSPTAFTSPEPGELYNNVVAFVVGAPGAGAGAGAEPPRRELHIFQCHDVAAHALVEELNALKSVLTKSYVRGGRAERGPTTHEHYSISVLLFTSQPLLGKSSEF